MCVLSVMDILCEQVQKSGMQPHMYACKVLNHSRLTLAACSRARVRGRGKPNRRDFCMPVSGSPWLEELRYALHAQNARADSLCLAADRTF